LTASEASDATCGAAFDPEDGVGVVRFHEETEMYAKLAGAAAETGGLFDLFETFELTVESLDAVDEGYVSISALFEEEFAREGQYGR